jgi:hypothetical protein
VFSVGIGTYGGRFYRKIVTPLSQEKEAAELMLDIELK